MNETALIRLLREQLSAEDLRTLRRLQEDSPEPSWDGTDAPALGRSLEDLVTATKRRIERRYLNLADLPPGRRETLLRNSSPVTLAELARTLIRLSFAQRFNDRPRSLELAELALQAAGPVLDLQYPSAESASDLAAEIYAFYGNALRLNSRFDAAQNAFETANQLIARGTGDRALRARLCSLWASLRSVVGESKEAAELFDREIRLRRLLGDPARLGDALVNRGIIEAWIGDLDDACGYLADGVRRTADPKMMLLSLIAVCERLARDGRGLEAWNVLCAAETVSALIQNPGLAPHVTWAKGITHRALGQLNQASQALLDARTQLGSQRAAPLVALVSLDLAAVRAAQGRFADVRELAGEALTVFKAAGLERRALSAVLILYRAAEAETVTATLARRVANFLVRFQSDRRTKFQGGDEWPEPRA